MTTTIKDITMEIDNRTSDQMTIYEVEKALKKIKRELTFEDILNQYVQKELIDISIIIRKAKQLEAIWQKQS